MSQQGPTVFNGRYELLRHMARGGMADVYLARDDLLDRHVALKVLFPEFANDPNFVERFRREAQAAANLNHPNVVGIYDWGQERGTYYIVMEFVEGRSMADVLRSTGPVSPDRVAEIAIDVAAALGAAHKAGLVHRDVKLGNILISDAGDVKVADFGIATALAAGTEAGLTQAGSVMGTATYFSPEQAQGKPLDGRSDLYSLGIVMYELLTGRPPFQADTPVAVAYKHVQERPVPPSQAGATLAPSLEAITMKLLAKNPANRYPIADDLKNDLRRYLDGAHQVPGRAAAAGAAGVAGAVAAGTPPAAAAPPGTPPTVATPPVQGTPPAALPVPVAPAAPVPVAPGTPPTAVPAGYVDPTMAMPAAAPPAAGYPPADYAYYEQAPPPRRDDWKRTALLMIGLAFLIGLLAYLLVAFIQTLGDDSGDNEPGPDDATLIDVPDVRDETLDDALRVLREQGFEFEYAYEENSDVDAEVVFEQDPQPGERVEEGSTIELRVSQGETLRIANVAGSTEVDARERLEQQGYLVVRRSQFDAIEEGVVIGTEPEATTELPAGSTVTLIVSDGPEPVLVPDVRRDPFEQAFIELRDLGFVVEQVDRASSSVDEGDVIETDPSGGTLLRPGDSIVVVVSQGVPQSSVPNVVGLQESSARTTLENQGFTVSVDFEPVPANSSEVGRVIDQNPPAGIEVATGTAVTIVVGEGTEPATTTTEPTDTTTTTEPTDTTTTTEPADTTTTTTSG